MDYTIEEKMAKLRALSKAIQRLKDSAVKGWGYDKVLRLQRLETQRETLKATLPVLKAVT